MVKIIGKSEEHVAKHQENEYHSNDNVIIIFIILIVVGREGQARRGEGRGRDLLGQMLGRLGNMEKESEIGKKSVSDCSWAWPKL